MLLTYLAIFTFFIFVIICCVLIFECKLLKPDKNTVMKEDNFIVSAPKSSLWVMVLFVFTLGSLASLVLHLISRANFLPALLWVVFIIFIGLAIYLIYGVVYYISYETKVEGNIIRHTELFYPEFTFTFNDIKRARYGYRVGNLMLIVSNSTEVFLEAEDHFVGFDLFVSCVENKASVSIENRDLAAKHRKTSQ